MGHGVPHHPDDAPQSLDERQTCPTCDRRFRWGEFQPPMAENALGTCPACGIHIFGFRHPPWSAERASDEGEVIREVS